MANMTFLGILLTPFLQNANELLVLPLGLFRYVESESVFTTLLQLNI